MVEQIEHPIKIDLNLFKLQIDIKNKIELTVHFDSPSRRFYLSLIAFVVNQMKQVGKVISIPLQEHLDLIILLNRTVGSSAGSSEKENLLPRVYRKWKDALPNLEEAPLFRIVGRRKEYKEGVVKTYQFTEAKKEGWANLFDYKGSGENVRLRFSIDRLGIGLEDVVIHFDGYLNGEAWERFISSLKENEAQPRMVAFPERMAYPLPDKPSIAVLPFVNMSDDPKQEFFCDGITDFIITALSRVPRIFVIARNSTFVYKGKPVKVKQVSEELGVQYVLEGSVQKSGDRVRITAQLIDAPAGIQLWAESYDRDLEDIFAVQDEITIKILASTQVKLTGATGAEPVGRLVKYFQGKQGLDCYLKLTEAMGYSDHFNIQDNNLARRMVEEAIAMCPENPMGYVNLGEVYFRDYSLGNYKSPRETLAKVIELAQKALAIDDSISGAHAALCWAYIYTREYDKAIAEAERALALNPGGIIELNAYAQSLTFMGRPQEGIPFFQKAIRLSPFGPSWVYHSCAHAFRLTGRYEEAVAALKKTIQVSPDNINARIGLATIYSMLGREKEARVEVAEVLRINLKFSLDLWAKAIPYKDQSQTDKVINALRKAGLK